MLTRFPARMSRAAMGLCAAALASAAPVRADEAWLQRSFDRGEATYRKEATATKPRERSAGLVVSVPRSRHVQRRTHRPQPAAPPSAPLLAQLGSVPIIGGIMSMLGLHEQRDRGRLQAMIGVDPVRTPWCGFLMGWAVRQAGRTPPPRHGLARAWKSYGSPVLLASAQAGDVVVTRTGRGSHVAAFHSRRGDSVCVAGGNQSNRVSVACVPARTVVAVRR